MFSKSARRFGPALALPLALALAACGDSADDAAVVSSEPIANIAAPEGQSWSEMVQVTEADGYLVGNPDAPIKLMEYASLTCGACANFTQTAAEEIKTEYVDTGRVSYELRNQIHNGIDLTMAALVRCGSPESFHPLSEQVWLNFDEVMGTAQQGGQAMEAAMARPENERFVAVAEATGLLDFFAARGLSRDQARQCLADSGSVTAIAERSNAQSAELDVAGTPTFFINGRQLDAKNWDQLEVALQEAGAR
ncbi:thioredoxin domain-containing protein [Qipengyuania sp. DSG2-2]|uniref:thioredoxin domain-containing protein n=1 Tax=Qipengyuania sp. DGS2-2 TaxID=3349631 RepID=UPI0036D2AD08